MNYPTRIAFSAAIDLIAAATIVAVVMLLAGCSLFTLAGTFS